jgi:hypothetical protein
MENENLERPAQGPDGDRPPRKPSVDMQILGYNLIALIIYTVAFKFVESGAVFDMLLIAAHLFVCILLSIVKQSGYWLLAGVLVLIIGFSTCVYFLPLRLN